MITYSGVRVAPENEAVPRPRDIAVAMGRITRYGGAVWCPLLAHSVLVAELVRRRIDEVLHLMPGAERSATWAWALLHDAHEVVMGEIPRPWKAPAMKTYEERLDARISASYGIPLWSVRRELVKVADERALLAEAVTLGLPNFREVYTATGRHVVFPEPDERELAVARAVLRSDFWRPPACLCPDSPAVGGFAQVLEAIETGLLAEAYQLYLELLDEVLPEVPA